MRSLLKSLLDDDHDMWGMHLSAKEAQRAAAQEAAKRMLGEMMLPDLQHTPTLEKVRMHVAQSLVGMLFNVPEVCLRPVGREASQDCAYWPGLFAHTCACSTFGAL